MPLASSRVVIAAVVDSSPNTPYSIAELVTFRHRPSFRGYPISISH